MITEQKLEPAEKIKLLVSSDKIDSIINSYLEVIVNSLENIPKQNWTEIRYEKKQIEEIRLLSMRLL